MRTMIRMAADPNPTTAAQRHSAESDDRPRVAVIDADRRVRQSLADLLDLAGLAVVGTAGSTDEAAALLETALPTVVLVDPRLPDVNAGEAFLAALQRRAPQLRVVLMGWSDLLERPSLRARAVAYLPKSSTPEEFLAATLAACGCETS